MLYNVAFCWLYLKEYINDARSHERQTKYLTLQYAIFFPLVEFILGYKHDTYLLF